MPGLADRLRAAAAYAAEKKAAIKQALSGEPARQVAGVGQYSGPAGVTPPAFAAVQQAAQYVKQRKDEAMQKLTNATGGNEARDTRDANFQERLANLHNGLTDVTNRVAKELPWNYREASKAALAMSDVVRQKEHALPGRHFLIDKMREAHPEWASKPEEPTRDLGDVDDPKFQAIRTLKGK